MLAILVIFSIFFHLLQENKQFVHCNNIDQIWMPYERNQQFSNVNHSGIINVWIIHDVVTSLSGQKSSNVVPAFWVVFLWPSESFIYILSRLLRYKLFQGILKFIIVTYQMSMIKHTVRFIELFHTKWLYRGINWFRCSNISLTSLSTLPCLGWWSSTVETKSLRWMTLGDWTSAWLQILWGSWTRLFQRPWKSRETKLHLQLQRSSERFTRSNEFQN